MLPISRSSEYAIRAMSYLAQRNTNGYCLVRDMSVELGIPAAFLGKVLQPLVARGLLHSQRGRNGGFRLAAPPADISLFKIVDSQEHLGRARQCFLGQDECSDERACPMHEFWKYASTDFLNRLTGTTLQDLLRFCQQRPESGYPLPHSNGTREHPEPWERNGPVLPGIEARRD